MPNFFYDRGANNTLRKPRTRTGRCLGLHVALALPRGGSTLWAGAINDTRGNASYCTLGNDASPHHCGQFGPLAPCEGAATFAGGSTGGGIAARPAWIGGLASCPFVFA